MKRIIMVICMLMTIAPEALPCRPLKTEDCGTTPPGNASTEYGIEAENSNRRINTYTLGYVFNLGLTNRMDAGFELPFQSLSSDDGSKGFGDVTLKTKYLLTNSAAPQTSLLLKLASTIPTGDEESGLGSGKSNFSGRLALTKSFGDFNTYFNLGYDSSSGFLGAGFQQPLGRETSLLWEFTYEPSFNSGDDLFTTAVGVTYTISEKVTYDVALRKSLNDTEPDYTLITGITTNF